MVQFWPSALVAQLTLNGNTGKVFIEILLIYYMHSWFAWFPPCHSVTVGKPFNSLSLSFFHPGKKNYPIIQVGPGQAERSYLFRSLSVCWSTCMFDMAGGSVVNSVACWLKGLVTLLVPTRCITWQDSIGQLLSSPSITLSSSRQSGPPVKWLWLLHKHGQMNWKQGGGEEIIHEYGPKKLKVRG